MFKIGEFSKITQVSVRMLRYYAEQELLNPCVIDASSGYRLYKASQIEELNRIILLRDLGFQVKEMKKMLESWNPEFIKSNLLMQIEKTKNQIQLEQNKLAQIQGYLLDLENQDKKLNIQIIMKKIPMHHVLSLRRVMPNYFCEGMLWEELCKRIGGKKNIDSKACISIYHDKDYREQNVDIEVCVIAEKEYPDLKEPLIYRQVQGVDMAACFMIYGPYENISIAYKEFAYWLEQHEEYCMAGENRQICHVSMYHTSNPEEYITELQIPLRLDSHMV